MVILHTSGVTNRRSSSLCYATRGHICKLCIYYKNFTIIQAVRCPPLAVTFTREVFESANNNDCGPLSEKVACPIHTHTHTHTLTFKTSTLCAQNVASQSKARLLALTASILVFVMEKQCVYLEVGT